MNREQAIEVFQAEASALQGLGVGHLYLFGSVARNEAAPASDIDLFFDMNDPKFSLLDLVTVKERLEDMLHTPVDVMRAAVCTRACGPGSRLRRYRCFEVDKTVHIRLQDILDKISPKTIWKMYIMRFRVLFRSHGNGISFMLKATSLAILFSLAVHESSADILLDPGKPAPLFSGTDVDGKAVGLSNYFGKTVVLEWVNLDCAAVKQRYEKGEMQELQAKAKANGFIWLTIVSPTRGHAGYVTREEAKNAITDWHGAPTDIIIDPSNLLTNLYGVQMTPAVFLIDVRGNVAYEGAIDSDAAVNKPINETVRLYLENALDALANNKGISPYIVNQKGCAV